MPEEKRRSDLDDLGFPFHEYLDESESRDDFPAQETEEQDIPKLLAGTFKDRLTILKQASRGKLDGDKLAAKPHNSRLYGLLKIQF